MLQYDIILVVVDEESWYGIHSGFRKSTRLNEEEGKGLRFYNFLLKYGININPNLIQHFHLNVFSHSFRNK